MKLFYYIRSSLICSQFHEQYTVSLSLITCWFPHHSSPVGFLITDDLLVSSSFRTRFIIAQDLFPHRSGHVAQYMLISSSLRKKLVSSSLRTCWCPHRSGHVGYLISQDLHVSSSLRTCLFDYLSGPVCFLIAQNLFVSSSLRTCSFPHR